MKLYTATLLIFFLPTSIYGQIFLPGKFMTAWAVDSSFYYNSTLTLNCDKTYTLVDSSFKILGNWEIKKKKLLLLIDSVISKLSTPQTGKREFIKLTIVDDKLVPKIISRRAYNKIPKLLEKQTGEVQKFESYVKFRTRNKNNYYKREKSFDCENSL